MEPGERVPSVVSTWPEPQLRREHGQREAPGGGRSGERGETAFHQPEPELLVRGEVRVQSRVLFLPASDHLDLARAVAVADQVDVLRYPTSVSPAGAGTPRALPNRRRWPVRTAARPAPRAVARRAPPWWGEGPCPSLCRDHGCRRRPRPSSTREVRCAAPCRPIRWWCHPSGWHGWCRCRAGAVSVPLRTARPPARSARVRLVQPFPCGGGSVSTAATIVCTRSSEIDRGAPERGRSRRSWILETYPSLADHPLRKRPERATAASDEPRAHSSTMRQRSATA